MSLVGESRGWGGPARRVAQLTSIPPSEYDFLLGRLVDRATLTRACAIARRWGVRPHEVMIANGWLAAEDYCRALARHCGAPYRATLAAFEVTAPDRTSPRQCLARGLLKERERARSFVFAPERLGPDAIREMLARLSPYQLSLASPHAVRRAISSHFAASVKTIWAVTLSLAILFVAVIAFRLVAAYGLWRGAPRGETGYAPRLPDHELPIYSVLVPLYREAHMLPQLVSALRRLDYPAAKLDIKIILEADDEATIAAANALRLPGNFEIVVVPVLQPRTKPKALNFALPLARGEYLVIYDAEDRPETGQLRRALHAFAAGPPNLAAVQARLNIYNAKQSWLTRQFTIEYCALFDGLLPALDRLLLPIPLGGTSNHFRASALRWLMAWDPFNVTEDADLGIRLAAWCFAALPSRRWHSAPWVSRRTPCPLLNPVTRLNPARPPRSRRANRVSVSASLLARNRRFAAS
ncbi:MAG: glycosyltransferase [Methyloceanibacter sp.]